MYGFALTSACLPTLRECSHCRLLNKGHGSFVDAGEKGNCMLGQRDTQPLLPSAASEPTRDREPRTTPASLESAQ